MIEAIGLTKRFGEYLAVDNLAFTVRPGIVTGFLGPNGAGKSTTMRMILGLDAPTAGSARVNGRNLAEHRAPMTAIGALLDAGAVHPKRSARSHLRALAATAGIGDQRVNELIDLVGLRDVADRRAGEFSLGMRQRLGIASALLGDPETVMLDEPVNGLDPEGMVWIRNLLRRLADEGRTVFVSSHLMSEMSMIAEHYVIVGRGRLIADVSAAELEAQAGEHSVRVRTPDAARLREALVGDGVQAAHQEPDVLVVTGRSSADIGRIAAEQNVVLHELTPQHSSLEDIFMELTSHAVEYRSNDTATREAA